MKEEGWPIPDGFNARPQTPDWSKMDEQLKEELAKIEKEVRRRCECENGNKKKGVDWAKMEQTGRRCKQSIQEWWRSAMEERGIARSGGWRIDCEGLQ